MNQDLLHYIQQKDSLPALSAKTVGGGSINQTYRLESSGGRMFCKVNSSSKFPRLFVQEQSGLELLALQKVIRTPAVIDCFEWNGYQVLLLEWISEGQRTEKFWETFGAQMAALHDCSSNTYGAHANNYMGSVPQNNGNETSWPVFFEHHRLRPMIRLCTEKKLLTKKHQLQFDSLFPHLSSLFESSITPVLVHGDLWSGNFMCDENYQPVLIDPAVYYGDASVDLAMTTLFGGFSSLFYESYHHIKPFPSNYREQWEVCNLYPLLIHLYLFGSSYIGQIEKVLRYY